MIEEYNGSVFDAETEVIAHQVNCKGVMGSGLAKQVKDKYREVYDEYLNRCKKCNSSRDLLGTCLLVKTHDGKYIANCFGQYSYGRKYKYTEDTAFWSAIRDMQKQMKEKGLKSVAILYRIGAGLAGGDWAFNYRAICLIFNNLYKECTVKICKI